MSSVKPFRAVLLSASLLAAGTGYGQQAATPKAAPPAATAPTATPAVDPASDDEAEAPKKKKAEEEIVVTGSRIRRKDLTTPAPVLVVTKEQIEHSAYQTIGDYLNSLPQLAGSLTAVNSQTNNGGTGATTVDLRGLGPQRTLVLLNGRRMVGVDQTGTVDLNTIPTAAVDRIEILLDGASGIYGSDAIGGVINIITKKTFDGSELYAYSGISGHGDGMVNDFRATLGTKGDKGNVLFSLEYFNQNPIYAGDRSYSSSQYGYQFTPGLAEPGGSTQVGGSFRTPTGSITLLCGQYAGNALMQKLCAEQSPQGLYIPDSTNSLGYRPATLGDLYNYQPLNYDLTPSQRLTAFATGDTHFTDNIRGYFEALFSNRQSAQQLAPLPLDTSSLTPNLLVSQNSVYNPFGAPFLIERRMVEWGPRIFEQNVDTFRTVLGVDGTIPDLNNWFWDVSFNYGRTDATQTNTGDAVTTGLQNAIGPSMVINGAPACVTTAGDPTTVIPGCVPLNLLGGGGSITPAMSNQPGLQYTGVQLSVMQQTQIQALANGELFKLWAKNPVSLALGYEYRREYGSFTPNPIAASQESVDQENAFATAGGYYINELFAEVNAPLVDDAPLLKALEAIGAIRYSNYSTVGNVVTGKGGLRWSPIKDITFRGTYSTGFRAPSIQDLYEGQFLNTPTSTDPCAHLTASTPAQTVSICRAQGVQAGGAGQPNTQINDTEGGNPALQPETSEQLTTGIVIQPRWVKGLSLTVDYYNFNIQNAILTNPGLGQPAIFQECYQQGVQSACNQITRSPITHQITNVLDLNTNTGAELTDGWDFQLHYDLPTESFGNFSFVFNSTYLNRFNETLPDGEVDHGAGNFDLGVLPNFKFNAGIGWTKFHGFGAGVNVRFLNSLLECGALSSPVAIGASNGACYQLAANAAQLGVLSSQLIHTIPAYAQTDVYLSYELQWLIGKTTLQAGINNLFDVAPPAMYNAFTPNADPNAYDFIGRFFYLKLVQKI